MTITILMTDGTIRTVDDHGRISTGSWQASEHWTFRGFAGAWNARGPTWTLDLIRADPAAFKRWTYGRALYGFDLDHGTFRRWGSPAIRDVMVTP